MTQFQSLSGGYDQNLLPVSFKVATHKLNTEVPKPNMLCCSANELAVTQQRDYATFDDSSAQL
jgi:hypothetical protein